MQRIIVIPARLKSTRLPRKPLLQIGGKPLIQWTYEIASRCQPDHLVVASPDEEILRVVEAFGGVARMTHINHASGTHRAAQVFWDLWDGDEHSLVMNLQADEPLLDHHELLRMFRVAKEMNYGITTIVAPIPEGEEGRKALLDVNLTKAAYSGTRCFWFSRAPMGGAYGHLGVYLFHARDLLGVAGLNPSHLSQIESLEQLTWIEAGHRIYAIETNKLPLSINTMDDLKQFRDFISSNEK